MVVHSRVLVPNLLAYFEQVLHPPFDVPGAGPEIFKQLLLLGFGHVAGEPLRLGVLALEKIRNEDDRLVVERCEERHETVGALVSLRSGAKGVVNVDYGACGIGGTRDVCKC